MIKNTNYGIIVDSLPSESHSSMFLPERHIPSPAEAPMVMPQGVDSTGQMLEIKLWKATPNHGTITHLEAEGDQGSIRYTSACRMYQALAQAGMRSVFQTVGIDAEMHPPAGAHPSTLNMAAVKERADLMLENNGDVETFKKNLEAALGLA